MAKIEFQMVTRRKVPRGLIEILNRQTSKDFSMKIRTQVNQDWSVDDLNIDFPLKVIPEKLRYSTGTRYAICLARNELLCHAEADYVLTLDDSMVISPLTVEILNNRADPNTVIVGFIRFIEKIEEWKGEKQYDSLFRRYKYGRVVNYSNRHDGLMCGFTFFPVELLKKINGWDLKFDGEWGFDDNDVGVRLGNMGIRFCVIDKIYSFHLAHESHMKEKNFKRTGEGLYIYNKKTGRKMNFNFLSHSERTPYFERHQRERTIRAPIGLKEVCELL